MYNVRRLRIQLEMLPEWQRPLSTRGLSKQERRGVDADAAIRTHRVARACSQRDENLIVDFVNSNGVRVGCGRDRADQLQSRGVNDAEHRAARVIARRQVVGLVCWIVGYFIRAAYGECSKNPAA